MTKSFSRPRLLSDEFYSMRQSVPGWVVSLVLHAILFLAMISSLRGCGGQLEGQPGEQFRDFGIVTRDPSPENTPDPEEADPTRPDQPATQSESDAIDEQPPAEPDLPQFEQPVIGHGPPPLPSNLTAGDPGPEVTSGGQRLRGSLGLGPGETSFYGVADSGTRFLYVIDCSGSMTGPRIRYARNQLKSSLRMLDRNQEFQVLFYNEYRNLLQLNSATSNGLYAATELNVASAEREIDRTQPNLGTRHFPALDQALRLRPDVLFYLTDGREPAMSAGQLEQLRRVNNNTTRVHAVEFGEGELLNVANWLQTLARQNGGQYKYINVSRLRR